ncbi:hypothetical protein L6470_13565 [Prevotella communis]|uniref:hypothetical protein n=1 Tax=Prevotella communis TaxID=2913614 RepID=UPI001EDC83B5|nr:hypothetical protein [Prevotella communis]UKK59372.1 hypothetical protein L6470_13565 [Prevotella communis]
MTSCSDDDDSVSQDYQKKLIGEWMAMVNPDLELGDENDVVYVLLSFNEDGVLFQKNYDGNTTEPLNCWERSCRHGIYTVNEAAHTIQCELFEGEAKFSFVGDQMIFTDSSNDVEMSLTFHRPSKAEKALLSMYDLSLEGNDYYGKWFMVQEENGKSTYTMLDFTEDSGLKTTRYTVTGDQCIRTDYSQFYGEDNSDEDGPMLEIYNSNDYFQRELYWWKVSANTLTLEKCDDSDEETVSTYHALTKADAALLAELEKKCPLIDNLTEKIKGKWMMAEVNGKPVVTNSKQVLTYETATKFYYSLSINAISDLNVWVNHCEGRYNANGTTLVQLVKLPNENIKFSQQFNILSVTDDEMQVYAMSETFIDDQSYRLTKDLRERKVRVKHDYSNDIIGTWEGRLTSDQDTYSDNELHRWEYKADGTFVYYRQNSHGEWVADVNTMAEYFVDGVLLCSRWKNVGDDTEKRESWEIASIDNGVMKWTALRQKEDGSTFTAQFSMTRVNP